MKCPTCGAWTEVKDTRHQRDMMTKRYRLCANNHRFQTVEMPARQGITPSEIEAVCAMLVAPKNTYVFGKKRVVINFIEVRKE